MDEADRDGPEQAHFRSRCSITRTLDIFGDKWTLLIVRDLLWHGKHTFSALHESAERIPTNILSDRLRRLEAWGMVERRRYTDRPPRHEYHLTTRGRSLEDMLLNVMAWGHAHLDGGFFNPRSGWSLPPSRGVIRDSN
jgi:DNA-binding HxlR family transcriptional regulator